MPIFQVSSGVGEALKQVRVKPDRRRVTYQVTAVLGGPRSKASGRRGQRGSRTPNLAAVRGQLLEAGVPGSMPRDSSPGGRTRAWELQVTFGNREHR